MSQPHIVISGAASGIGKETALRFLAEGWLVTALDRNEQALHALEAEAASAVVADSAASPEVSGSWSRPGTLQIFALDVTDAGAWGSVLEQATAATRTGHTNGRVDAMINNAGILIPGRFTDLTPQQHRATVDVNVIGVMNGAHAAHPYLSRTPGSVLVNLASAAAIYGQSELASYSSSKFAVRGLTEALSIEWQRDGVDVVALWPLFVSTPLIDGIDIAPTRAMGVKLTAADVVTEIHRVVTEPGARKRVHRRVGRQAKWVAAGVKFAPESVARRIVSGLAKC